jgi:CHASE3 domain sensor protein
VKLLPLRWLADVIARVPVSISTKLLVAFLAIAALLVVVGAVGLAELGMANQRTEDLAGLQRKIAAYRQIQHDTLAQLHSVSSALLVPDAARLDATLRQLNQFGYDLDRLQFVAQDEVELFTRVRQEYEVFIAIVQEVVEKVRAGQVVAGLQLQTERAGPQAWWRVPTRVSRTTLSRAA